MGASEDRAWPFCSVSLCEDALDLDRIRAHTLASAVPPSARPGRAPYATRSANGA